MYITGTALPSLAFHKEILGFYQKKTIYMKAWCLPPINKLFLLNKRC